MDIMLGNWASKNLHALNDVQLSQFADVLKLENPDLFKWLTGQAPVPPEVCAPPSLFLRHRVSSPSKAPTPCPTCRSRGCARWTAR